MLLVMCMMIILIMTDGWAENDDGVEDGCDKKVSEEHGKKWELKGERR